jgi:hypothetical protein
MYITNPMQTGEGRARRILIRTIMATPMQNAGERIMQKFKRKT